MSQEQVNQLKEILGCDSKTAASLLQKTQNDLNSAITLHYQTKDRRINRMTDLKKNKDEKKGQGFYAGGKSSGIEYYGGKKNNKNEKENETNLVDKLFNTSKERIDKQDNNKKEKESEKDYWSLGGGSRIGKKGEQITYSRKTRNNDLRNNRNNQQKIKKKIELKITFWKNGFTINDSELKDYEDTQNKKILEELEKGFVPREVLNDLEENVDPDISVSLVENRQKDFVPPKKKIDPFGGQGNRIGGSGGRTSKTGYNSYDNYQKLSNRVNNNVKRDLRTERMKHLVIDQNKPTTMLQIRLPDGEKEKMKLNTDATISKLRLIVSLMSEELSIKPFNLICAFPRKPLLNDQLTLKEADLLNAAILVQFK
ncbi:hypothetical protein M0813_00471 [Anaeramoeba flamelloides]|uniref:UBX domain-containing protein n=1 Tax=Anaeramoeba flamelloides TaxID=1746091 RepID=A0ABQ8YB20_9EUKA|nr:hypothetical protein M0813_00471 [Anaeramoeba flamelloides]